MKYCLFIIVFVDNIKEPNESQPASLVFLKWVMNWRFYIEIYPKVDELGEISLLEATWWHAVLLT